MNFKRFMVVFGMMCLAAVLVFSWGCQNQPTGPEMGAATTLTSSKTRDTGNCSAGSFSVSFSGASFVTGLGWSTGSSRSISWSGSCSNCNWGPGVYGWMTNPLVEYYIPRSGGSGKGSYSCGGSTWNVGTEQRVNQPSIEGTATFTQYFASGGGQPIDMSCHYSGWRNVGLSVGSQNYQVVAVENWSGGSGSASVSVPNSSWYTHWVGSGSATFTCGGGGGSTTTTSGGSTTTTSGGGSTTTSGGYTTTTSGGGGGDIVIRARGKSGDEHMVLKVGGSTVADWTVSTSTQDYSASTSNSGTVEVCFDNDDYNGRDLYIESVTVGGDNRGGGQWIYSNGCNSYGSYSGGGGSTTTTSGGSSSTTTTSGGSSSTTTSGGWWWSSTTTSGGSTTTTSGGYTTTTSGGSTTTSGGGGVPEWNSSTVYNDGDQVQYNGNLYEANWYSQGQNPETNSGQWQVWTLIGSM